MFGRLLRVTGTVLVIAVAFVTPVLATSSPASADTVVNGCTVVSNPTAKNFTNCPGVDFTTANLSGVDLSFANLAGAVFANCDQSECGATDLVGTNLTDANLTSTTMAECSVGLGAPLCEDADLQDADLTGANLTDAVLASCSLTAYFNAFCGEPPTGISGAQVNLSGANLTDATVTGATFGTCLTSDGNLSFWEDCGGANLTGATLTGVNLTGVDLSGSTLVPSFQSVTPTSAAGAVVTWPTPPSLPGATPGSCTPPSGSTFPFSGASGTILANGLNTVTCQVVDGLGDVTTGTFLVQVSRPSPPTTSVLLPSTGATVSGDTLLDAAASSPIGVASVTFYVSADSIDFQAVGTGVPTLYGWIGGWDTTDVPNGTYTLVSAATDALESSTQSAAITVTVDNLPLHTTVLVPSSGATLSGSAAVLDASASGTSDVTGVQFVLSGGSLSNQVVGTATLALWGWYVYWDTTSVPNGTYTLQSVATEVGGTTATSPGITVTVQN